MAANVAGIESATTNAFEHAEKQIRDGDRKGAMETLHNALEQRVPIWVKNHEKIILQFFALAVADEKEKVIRSALQAYQRLCVASQELGSFEEVVLHLLKISAAKVAAVISKKEAASRTVENTDLWCLYSDEPAEQTDQRRRENVMQFFSAIFRHTTGRTAHDGKFAILYQGIVQAGFEVCRTHGCFNELYSYSEASRRQLEEALRRDEHRTSIMNRSDVIDAIIRTKLLQIEVASDMKHWRVAANAMEETKNFFDAVQQQRKVIKVDHWIPFYQQVAKVFFQVEQPTLHSFAMIKGARLSYMRDRGEKEKADEVRTLASAAVLSVLCLPYVDASAVTFTSDEAVRDHRKQAALERFVGVTVAPTRASLVTDLTSARGGLPSLLDLAFPEVQQLYALMHAVSTFDVCQKVKPLIDQIKGHAKLSAQLTPYVPTLESVAVQSMMTVMARCYSKVTIPHLQALVPFYSADQYVTHLEPLLLNPSSSNVRFTIDMTNNCVVMGRGSKNDVVGALGKFAADLAKAVPVCYAETGGRAAKNTEDKGILPANPKSLFAQMQAEKERLAAKHEICKKRLSCEDDRAIALKKKEADRKQAEIDKIRKVEQDRFDKLRRDADRKAEQQIEELKMVEQHKWVVTVLKQRHPGLAIDDRVAKLSNDKFKEEVTANLTKFTKGKSSKKSDGLRDREHLERAIREEEVPLVKAMAEARREAPEEREARLAKRTEQLKKDHEHALVVKKRLAAFEADRRQYEEKFLGAIRRSAAAKVGKMDAQEELLRQEKERREREAREAEEEEEQSRPAPAAEKKSYAPLGGGKGAWKPKGR